LIQRQFPICLEASKLQVSGLIESGVSVDRIDTDNGSQDGIGTGNPAGVVALGE
jgi:hypothetical protein